MILSYIEIELQKKKAAEEAMRLLSIKDPPTEQKEKDNVIPLHKYEKEKGKQDQEKMEIDIDPADKNSKQEESDDEMK